MERPRPDTSQDSRFVQLDFLQDLDIPQKGNGTILGETVERIVVRPEDIITKKEEFYYRGDYEIENTCECGQNLIMSVRLVTTFKTGKQKISVDESCPHHGLKEHYTKVINPEQLGSI